MSAVLESRRVVCRVLKHSVSQEEFLVATVPPPEFWRSANGMLGCDVPVEVLRAVPAASQSAAPSRKLAGFPCPASPSRNRTQRRRGSRRQGFCGFNVQGVFVEGSLADRDVVRSHLARQLQSHLSRPGWPVGRETLSVRRSRIYCRIEGRRQVPPPRPPAGI